MLYAESDESSYIWVNDAGNAAYIVDAGIPPLFKGLAGVLTNPAAINDVYIVITHYHIDHCQALSTFIYHTDARIHLYLHRD